MAWTLNVGRRGELDLPPELLDSLGLKPGDKLSFELLPGGKVALTPVLPKGDIRRARGALYQPGQAPVSIEAMREGYVPEVE